MSIFKKFFILSLLFFIPLSLFSADTNNDDSLAVIYTIKGDVEKKYNAMMEEKLKTIGFNLTDPHKRVNDQYKKKYGSTVLDVLSFMPVVNDKMMLPLLNIDPRISGFGPFNMLIAKKLDEDFTQVGHLSPKVMLDILGIKDQKVRDTFTESFVALDAMIEKELGGKKSHLPLKKLPEQTMLTYEYTFEPVEDIEDFMDEFQGKFEDAFIEKEYLIAGYHNFMEGTPDAAEVLKDYDAFWTYSLCHLEFSYNMFDTENAKPLAGLFAPCTMYMFIPKGSNKLIVGMYRLHNWTDSLGITDEKRVKLVEKLDREIPELLTSLGMKAIPNVNPKTLFKTAQKKIPEKISVVTPVPPTAKSTGKTNLATMYTIKGDVEKKYNAMMEEKLKTIGFNLTDPHKRVNDQYKKKYGSTVLDVLSFMPVVNDKMMLPLLNIDPRISGFGPFNMLIAKKLDEDFTQVGHLSPKVMLDILGIKDQKVRDTFTESFVALDAMIEKELGGKKSHLPLKKLPEQTMLTYEYTFEPVEDIEDFMDEFQGKFEDAFIEKEYLIAGYHNFMEGTPDAAEVLKDYDAFWTYSLCHLEFSYNMFDTENAKPLAGLFAPCTMYMFIPKGSNKLIVGMYRLHNWTDSLGITDEKRVKLVEKLDREIPELLTSLGMKAIPNVNPLTGSPKPIAKPAVTQKRKVPIVPAKPSAKKEETKAKTATTTETKKTIKIPTSNKTVEITLPVPPKPVEPVKVKTFHTQQGILDRSIKFSKRMPPNYIPPEQRIAKGKAKNTATDIGEVVHGRVPAYIRGKYIDVKEAEKRLKKAGFTILGETTLDKKGNLVSIVFTDKELTKMASKKNRGFAASLRLLVDKKDNHISITNPIYMAKAFMQDQYDDKAAKATLKKITDNFENLLNSKDKLKFQLLPNYQFMHGMPKYQDMVVVARGDNLLSKIKNNKKVLFVQKLDNGATLIGVALGRRTGKFIGRIGTNNAALLPYPILIENGEAKIMEPKYYISVMYPLLQMSEFMTIATVPGAIIRDCGKVFK
ncbi:hypothetical protein [Sulfurovum sp. NBC37-1]|uniref:hypothetical protein n=1 Tax=Sulfurovum sp. (strain NBC37-1) TaxID=387093 RepID=UPI00015875E3|nr:hypothetical protein [Sulfurovum sp. NBC37-1]BAF71519.1 hypothetical protein SUN_0559 [Sulfurovum sp. NBC37-1]